MALMQQIAGVSVNGAGQLIDDPQAVGADSSLNVPPTAIPLPNGYPSGIPTPYVTNGKIQFTPVPPNFDPATEQVAWMMWALQVWVLQYGTQKYNVFEYRSNSDGTGGSIATWIQAFCTRFMTAADWERRQRSSPTSFLGQYETYEQKMTNIQQISMQRRIQDFDFGNPPPPYTPSGFEKAITSILDTIAVAVLRFASNLLPVIGPAYASFWLKEFTTDEGAIFTGEVLQDAQNIATAAQVTAAANAAEIKKNRLKQALIGAGIALALWVAYDND